MFFFQSDNWQQTTEIQSFARIVNTTSIQTETYTTNNIQLYLLTHQNAQKDANMT